MTTTSATSSSATPDGTPAALAHELTHALSLMSPADRLKSAGDVGLLSRVVLLLCEVTIDNGTRATIEAMFAEITVTVDDMRRCGDNREELVAVFVRLRKQVIDRDPEIDCLVALLARGRRPVEREQLVAGFQREHRPPVLGKDSIRRSHKPSDLGDERVPSDLFHNRRPSESTTKRERKRSTVLFRRDRAPAKDESPASYERNQAERFRRYYIAGTLVLSGLGFVGVGAWLGIAVLAGLCGYLRGQARGHRNNELHDRRQDGVPENLYEGSTQDTILTLITSLIRRNQG